MTFTAHMSKTCTTCPYCGVGCGVIASVDEHDNVTIKGDVNHPANFGKLCSKGSALAETLGDGDRLLYPYINGQRIHWETALQIIADKFSTTVKEYGPESVAFYVSGQLLTEDYYIANKLMKGYIGSANIDTNSRLCMASSVVGHKRAFGADIVPGCYEDLESADLLVLTGSNLAWCHPILYQRIAVAKVSRPEMKIVVIDPRRTASCDIADIHLPLAPGSDVPLFQGLFNFLDRNGHADNGFIFDHTENYEDVLLSAITFDIETVSELTRLTRNQIRAFYKLFAETSKVVTIYSQGVNQAKDGTDKVNAIINCHLLTGRIGNAGMGPFSVTGQPNAMGGREVGGLANQLASHMDIENPAHRDIVQRFWKSPKIPENAGLKAVELFESIHAGHVKAVWIMGTNPVDSLPNADFVEEALSKCGLVVVSDIIHHTDTTACADILLPSTGWGEKDGSVTNSERRISRQRAFLQAPGETRPDWWQLCEVAKRMGFGQGFDFENSAEIFREYARLCAFENEGSRDLDLSGLVHISNKEYDSLGPVQWPVTTDKPQGQSRFFSDGRFFTKSQKANFISPAGSPKISTSKAYPFILNTGRIRDHWHTMTRTGRAARLSQHISEPFVEVHPEDAAKIGLVDADIATLSSPFGDIQTRVIVTVRQKIGSLFVPMHFTDQFSSAGRVGKLIAPDTDPFSGQPASKSTSVNLYKYEAKWYGFAAIAKQAVETLHIPHCATYWAKATIEAGVKLELAGLEKPENWKMFLHDLLAERSIIDVLDMISPVDGQTRMACFKGGRLMALLFTSASPVIVSREWACSQLLSKPSGMVRHHLLAGRPGADVPDKGAIICSCMNIGLNEIRTAIGYGCASVDAIGQATGAGTNCGSCQPEIRHILKEARFVAAQ